MPALAPISINDGAATPVAHVFTPIQSDRGVAEYANRSATIPQGCESLKVDVRRPTSATAAWRFVLSMEKPTVGTVDGQEKVVRFGTSAVTLNISQLSTEQERKDQLKLLANLLLHPDIVSAVTKLESMY